ncbi:MAG: KAP family NTPase [Arcobacteraceae bacterium]|nr:KAP family NTPase [Arcobacteraceae bacterium]
MSNLATLRQYLIDSDKAFLTDPNNNGKIVMLSGAWGSGKTHFWQNEIETPLREDLNSRAKSYVYISLYGKTNIETIKQEILFQSFKNLSKESGTLTNVVQMLGIDVYSPIVSVFGTDTLKNTLSLFADSRVKEIGDIIDLSKESKINFQGTNNLTDGGLICIDDFERKSKDIDLNDLFGFIYQIAYELKCIVVIILNDDVFENEEAKVFKSVKEKTISKFFYFQPSQEDLFDSILKSNNKYSVLEEYKDEILEAILYSNELNARIYIQALDNCLEWIEKNKDSNFLYSLSIFTINFVLNHFVVDIPHIEYNLSKIPNGTFQYDYFNSISQVSFPFNQIIGIDNVFYSEAFALYNKGYSEELYFNYHINRICNIKNYEGNNPKLESRLKITNENKIKLEMQYKYCYGTFEKIFKSRYVYDNLEIYKEMNNFIKTGVLIKEKG